MRRLIEKFTPGHAGSLPRRTYPVERIPFDLDAAALFHQEADAQALFDLADRAGDWLAVLFNPARPGQRRSSALVLRSASVELIDASRQRTAPLTSVTSITLTLSPLVGGMALGPAVRTSFPAPLADRWVQVARATRRALASSAT